MTSTHYLPVPPAAFVEIAQRRQHALCLPKSEQVCVGDYLVLREQREGGGNVKTYTGAWLFRRVTAVSVGEGLLPTHAVYSFATSEESERARVAFERQLCVAEQQGVPPDRFFRHQERRQRAKRDLLRKNAEIVARARASGSEAR